MTIIYVLNLIKFNELMKNFIDYWLLKVKSKIDKNFGKENNNTINFGVKFNFYSTKTQCFGMKILNV